ncbi:hypothetical protein D3C73_1614660 [compost metagenome]
MHRDTDYRLGYRNAHSRHNAGAGEYRIKVLQAEHAGPPVDSAQHGVVAVVEGVNQHIPDGI